MFYPPSLLRPALLRPALYNVAVRNAPPCSIALPVAHTLTEAAIVAVSSGLVAVAAQVILVRALDSLNMQKKRWANGYVAHHVVCLFFMLAATVIGTFGWLSPAGTTAA